MNEPPFTSPEASERLLGGFQDLSSPGMTGGWLGCLGNNGPPQKTWAKWMQIPNVTRIPHIPTRVTKVGGFRRGERSHLQLTGALDFVGVNDHHSAIVVFPRKKRVRSFSTNIE